MAADVPYSPVPTVRPNGAGVPEQNVPVNPEAFGAGFGQQLERLGAGISEERARDVSVDRQIDEQEFVLRQHFAEQREATRANDASTAYSAKANDLELEFSKLKGQQAVDALPEYQKQLVQAQAEIGKTLKSPLAQRAFHQDAERYKASSLHTLGLHSAAQSDEAYQASLNGRIDAASARAVLHSGNNDIAPDFTEITDASLAKAHFLGLPKEAADAMVQGATSATMQNIIAARIASGHPLEAQTLFNDALKMTAPGTDIPILHANQIAQIGVAVHAGIQNYAKDYLQTLDPAARVSEVGKALQGPTNTPLDYLDPGDKAQAFRDAQNALRIEEDRREAELKKAQAKINERLSSDLKIKVDAGEATVPDVEDAFDKHIISGAERASWINEINKTGDYQGLVLGALSGATVLDPRNEKDRNAASTYFDKVVAPNLQGMKPDEAKTVITQYVERLGIVPERLRGQIRGGLRAGSPALRVTAADIIDRLSESSPHALDDFSTEDIAEGKMLAGMIRDGIPQDHALLQMDEMRKLPKDVLDLRRKRLTEGGPGKSLLDTSVATLERNSGGGRSWLGFFGGFGRTQVGDAAQAEFRRDFERAYLLTGDQDVAAKSAASVIKRNWGVSTVNGTSQFMKYAPEAVYGVLDHRAEDGAWIRQQLLTDVAKETAKPTKAIVAGAFPEGMLPPDDKTQSPYDTTKYPAVRNPDGSISSVITIIKGFEEDGKEVQVLLPSMIGGHKLTTDQAVEHYRQTGENFGKFESVAAAEKFDADVHKPWNTAEPKPTAVDPSRVTLAPDLQTGRDLTYGVMLRNDNGAYEPMLDAHGRAMRWKPDFATSDKAVEMKRKKDAENAAAIESARRLREYYNAYREMHGAAGPVVTQ